MNKLKVGVQGIPGSFSEMAAKHYLKNHNLDNYELVYLINSKNVLQGIESGECDYGVFAVENSTGGIVLETIRALAKHCCEIEELFHIAIKQNLLTLPEIEAKDIHEIYSHPQALLQCKEYLAKNYAAIPQREARDTALAAQELQQGKIPSTTAVIGNSACAKLYGLKILVPEINDRKDNQTLFIAATALKDEA